MSDNPPYDRAVKPLDFGVGGVVTVKTNTKQSSYSKVRDIKKLQYIIELPIFSLDATTNLVKNIFGRWCGQFNFLAENNFRVTNYGELKYYFRNDLSMHGNYLITIRFRLNGELIRYKLIGFEVSPRYRGGIWIDDVSSDVGLPVSPRNDFTGTSISYRSFVSAPWYTGQIIYKEFVLEVFRLQGFNAVYPAVNETLKNINTSRIRIPVSLEETDPKIQSSQSFTRDNAGVVFGQNFPVVLPAGLTTL